MPADRGRSSRRTSASERDADYVLAPAWSSVASGIGRPSETSSIKFEQEVYPLRRKIQPRKKAENHIPRPPNAFILFRSSFIKNRHVSTGVETNHSTLSKIIGITWQTLPEAERQKWHEEAKIALAEHKRQFPQYSFRPVHTKPKGAAAERRKLREVGPKDQKRCAKIAELLVCGKKGQELEEAIQEFDKHHVPEIVTRFEEPMTASTYATSEERRSVSPVALRKRTPAPTRPMKRAPSAIAAASPFSSAPLPSAPEAPIETITTQSFNDTFAQSPSFDFESFSFSVGAPPSFPLTMSDGNITMSHNEIDTQQISNPCHLSPTSQYPPLMDEWTRHGSPLSNSTSSMPSTPLQPFSSFPEHFPEAYHPGPFQVSTNVSDYGPPEAAYCEFTQYPPYASMPGTGYAGGSKNTEHALELDGRFHLPPTSSPHLEEHLDFSSFIQLTSLPASYSL